MFAKNNQFQRERLSTSEGISLSSLGPNAEKVGILHAAKKGFHAFILRTSCQT